MKTQKQNTLVDATGLKEKLAALANRSYRSNGRQMSVRAYLRRLLEDAVNNEKVFNDSPAKALAAFDEMILADKEDGPVVSVDPTFNEGESDQHADILIPL